MKNEFEMNLPPEIDAETSTMLSPAQRYRMAAELLAGVVLRLMKEDYESDHQN